MQALKLLETPVLATMLTTQSEAYKKMLFNNDRSEVFDECENFIFFLQLELNSRRPESELQISQNLAVETNAE